MPQRPQPSDLDADSPDKHSLLRRLYAELWCLGLTFRFHGRNNHLRKAVTLMVVLTWIALEVGNAYGLATLPPEMLYLRAFVGLLLGRMWDLEIEQFAGLKTEESGDTNDQDN